ncbi:MAG: hypothetical protein QXU18_08570 [Thermoplasmatales archaeon]
MIAFDVPGIRESVLNGKTGLLVKYGNERAMGDSQMKIAYDRTPLSEMSENEIANSKNYS